MAHDAESLSLELARVQAILAEKVASLAEKDALLALYTQNNMSPRWNPWADSVPSSTHSSNSKLRRNLKKRSPERCQVTDLPAETAAEGEVITAHIWPRRHKGKLVAMIPGIKHTVESAKNGLFLAKSLEYAFDHLEVCFLQTSLRGGLILKVLRKDTNMRRRIQPGRKSSFYGTVWDWNNKPLRVPGCNPSLRTLSAHAVSALNLAKDKKWITESQFNQWMPLALFNSPPQKSASEVKVWLQSSGVAPPD